MKVFKFGGASVKNSEAVINVGRILKQYDDKLVVVISAMGKTTNLMESLLKVYFEQDDNTMWKIYQKFLDYHNNIINELFSEQNIPESIQKIYQGLCDKLNSSPSLDYNFEYDQLVGFGELVSTGIVSEYLNLTAISNKWIDIRTCLKTDDNFRDASVNWMWTKKLVRSVFSFNNCNLYITQGFLGATTSNLSTTNPAFSQQQVQSLQ